MISKLAQVLKTAEKSWKLSQFPQIYSHPSFARVREEYLGEFEVSDAEFDVERFPALLLSAGNP